MGFFYDELFCVQDEIDARFDRVDIAAALDGFLATFSIDDDMNTWFEKIKTLAESLGYTADMKAYKADPAAYRGSVADISMFLRVAVTGKLNAPDLWTVMQILGADRTAARIRAFRASL